MKRTMNNSRFLMLLALQLFVAACSSQQGMLEPENIPVSDEEVYSRVVGTWAGTIPCADCPGISYTLRLEPDSTYRERMVYEGRSATPFVQTGEWDVNAGRLRLNKQSKGRSLFELAGDTLLMLDADGNRIKSPLADAYTLQKLNPDEPEDNPKLWREKLERGIDFAAVGSNKPFWSLEIDMEKMIEFKVLDDESDRVLATVPVAEKPATGEGIVYRLQTVSSDLEIQIIKATCINIMSGREFPYTVTILKDGMEYTGCGMYLRDSRLEGNWKLVELEGKAINPKEFEREQPHLVFSLADGRVSGNAGCNRINGSMEPRGYKLFFGAIASTRMACPNMELENQFLQALSEKELGYKVDDKKLELLDNGKVVLVFERGE